MKNILSKIVSYLLIIFGFYHIILSAVSIFFIYPIIFHTNEYHSFQIQEGLVEKAIIIYVSTVIDGFYGIALLVKPTDQIKTVHILAGLFIFVFSIFFITKSKVTNDPLFILFSYLYNKH
ncbi:MAG TPA: hypothetical protein VMW41_03910 [Candidatus Bathyarchaeia archaeon]|nr:hypothetical protein [Candidatus Bathyarchaeia archaeon]